MMTFTSSTLEKTVQLQLIRVKGLKSGDPRKFMEVADATGDAARSFGSFRICDHGIDRQTVDEVYRVAEQFFSLQDDFKNQY